MIMMEGRKDDMRERTIHKEQSMYGTSSLPRNTCGYENTHAIFVCGTNRMPFQKTKTPFLFSQSQRTNESQQLTYIDITNLNLLNSTIRMVSDQLGSYCQVSILSILITTQVELVSSPREHLNLGVYYF